MSKSVDRAGDHVGIPSAGGSTIVRERSTYPYISWGGNLMPIERDCRLFVPGQRGVVGGALLRKLHDEGFTNVLTASRHELGSARQFVGVGPRRSESLNDSGSEY